MNALERYNKHGQDNGMQEPFETTSGLHVWEQWTYSYAEDKITSIRFYCEDINGGQTYRLSKEDFDFMCSIEKF